jgi:Toprim-like
MKDFPTIPQVAQKLAPNWKPDISCRSPFREDNKPSFSVYSSGTKWKDFGTGEGGDVVDFVAHALFKNGSSDFVDLRLAFAWLKGAQSCLSASEPRPNRVPKPLEPLSDLLLLMPSYYYRAAISESRKLPLSAIEEAVRQGLLWVRFDPVESQWCWVLTDHTRYCALERSMDAKPFQRGKATGNKSKTLSGSAANWPIGVTALERYDSALLTEGAPDCLAGWADTCPVICMSSASVYIHDLALPYFSKKEITIAHHNDKPGLVAAHRWAEQIKQAGGTVELMPPPAEHKDLNEWITNRPLDAPTAIPKLPYHSPATNG